jgi:hypothetical protein
MSKKGEEKEVGVGSKGVKKQKKTAHRRLGCVKKKTVNLCELLQVPEPVETEQPSIVAKQQNRDASIGGWGCEFLDLCRDVELFIFNG